MTHKMLTTRQAEAEQTGASSTPRPIEATPSLRRPSASERLSLYGQAWGNRPPPWLRLSPSLQQPDESIVHPPYEPVPFEAVLPVQRIDAVRAQLLGQHIPIGLRLSTPQQETGSGHAEPVQRAQNTTGLPDTLKAGVEGLAGISLDDVHVQYHSAMPAQMQALAYTQGSDIHVGPGQEQHLAHEAWHVVQQKQGRVQQTMQLKNRAMNTDRGLEQEAEVMGRRALSTPCESPATKGRAVSDAVLSSAHMPIQRMPANQSYSITVATNIFKPTQEGYMAHLEQSTYRLMAYIVNAIFSYREIEKIPQVVASILQGLKNFEGRVGFVFGINAPEDQEKQLKEGLVRVGQIIDDVKAPVAIVPSTYTGDFPYGTMRNRVMRSQETAALVAAFAAQNLHPYLSFQDFDTGERTVPSGEHIFNYLENTLRGDEEDKEVPATRPLMITGGYRPGADLAESTKGRFEGKQQKLPDELKDEEHIKTFVTKFGRIIKEDMQAREALAKIHPLLPYAPEPNLFIDALPMLFGLGNIEFGKGKAEFTQLGNSLNEFLAWELDHYFSRLYAHAKPSISVPRGPTYVDASAKSIESEEAFLKPATFVDVTPEYLPFFEPEDETLFAQLDQEEIRAQLQIHAQTGQHPLRGLSFFTDFMGGSIVTDLSRLAHGFLESGRPLQSHAQLTPVVDRFFEGKPAKEGVSFAKYRETYKKRPYEKREPLRSREQGSRAVDFSAKEQKLLGSLKKNKMSRAISASMPKNSLFSGEHVGIPEEHKVLSGHAVATSSPDDMRFRRLALIQQMLQTLISVGGTPVDGNCLYHAVNQAQGGGILVQDAQKLRDTVVGWLLAEDNLPLIAHLAFQGGVDLNHLIYTIARNGNWAGNAGDLAPQVVASALGVSILIHSNGQQTTINPLSGQAQQTITIYLQNNHYSIHPPQ